MLPPVSMPSRSFHPAWRSSLAPPEAQARRAPSTPLTPSVLNTSPEQVGDELPNWLQELTPSALASASSGNSGPFTPFNMSDYPTHGASSNLQAAHQNTSSLPAPGTPFHPGELGASNPNGSNGPAVAPAGPYADLQMPLPHELPGGMEGFGGPPIRPPAKISLPTVMPSPGTCAEPAVLPPKRLDVPRQHHAQEHFAQQYNAHFLPGRRQDGSRR